MVALTAKTDRKEKEGKLIAMPVAVANIFAGALVKINAAGYLAPAAAEAGAKFAGVAQESCDNSAGAVGDATVRVSKYGSFLMNGTGFTQANLGDEVYASDDNTVSTTQGTNEQLVGVISEFISATQVRVRIDMAAK